MTADDYVQIDRQEETGQNLYDTETVRRTEEEENSDNETPDSNAFQRDSKRRLIKPPNFSILL